MDNEIYADGIGQIRVTGSVIRIDLVSQSRTGSDGAGNPQLEHRMRVVMPLDGFVRSFSSMEDIMNKLFDAGVLRRENGELEPSGPDISSKPN